MSKTFKIVLTSVCATLVCAYLISAMVVFPDHKKEKVCQRFDITIIDSAQHRFISALDLRQMLRSEGLLPENKPYGEIQTHAVEEAALRAEVINDAQCYKTNDGTVRLLVNQREPRLRVISASGEENYYVDADRSIMKASFKTACHVPVVTGAVTHEMAKNELFDFTEWLDDHSFWNAQIEQINVRSNREVELIPRVGGHVILLGSLTDYEQKLDKLATFYDEGFNKVGWLPYSEVDLRFKGQIVCR